MAVRDDMPKAKTRSIKYMHGVLGGKWVVGMSWVDACLQKRGHTDEGSHEIEGSVLRFNKTIQICKMYFFHHFLHG